MGLGWGEGTEGPGIPHPESSHYTFTTRKCLSAISGQRIIEESVNLRQSVTCLKLFNSKAACGALRNKTIWHNPSGPRMILALSSPALSPSWSCPGSNGLLEQFPCPEQLLPKPVTSKVPPKCPTSGRNLMASGTLRC